MRLRIYSDLHLEFAPFDPPDSDDVDLVILAGDIHVGTLGVEWALETFPDVPVLYVAGNHEYYQHTIPSLTEDMVARCEGTNVHVLERATAIVDGVRFLGCTLWTDMALYGNAAVGGALVSRMMSDYRVIRVAPQGRLLRAADTMRFHRQSVEWLRAEAAEADGPLVVVSHHGPTPDSIDPRFGDHPSNAGYVSRLEPLIEEIQPVLWIHGHVHTPVQYRVGRTTVISNPRGYPDETVSGFDPELVVEVRS